MAEEVAAQLGAEARREPRREVLRREGDQHPEQAHGDEQAAALEDVGSVALRHSHVDDLRHDQRHDQAKERLEQLEERGEHALLFVMAQIARKS